MVKGQHTPGPEAGANRPTVIERKHKPDGSIREYPCELVHLDRGLAVVRFHMSGGGGAFHTPFEIPAGSMSDGYFWARRPYNLYRIRRPDGTLIAHRFDAVTDVRLGPELIEYRDLVLDWWVEPGGRVIEEDRDELEELAASARLSAADLDRAREATHQVYRFYRHVIDEVEALERKFGLVEVTPGALQP